MRILFILVLMTASAAAKELPASQATLGRCIAAINDAQASDNEWRAPFPKSDCEKIAIDMIDEGHEMMREGYRQMPKN